MPGPSGKDRDRAVAAAQAEVTRWETLLADQLHALWARQEGVVLARLQGTKARRGTRHWYGPTNTTEVKALDPRYVLDPGRWLLEAVNAARALLRRLVRAVVDAALAKYGRRRLGATRTTTDTPRVTVVPGTPSTRPLDAQGAQPPLPVPARPARGDTARGEPLPDVDLDLELPPVAITDAELDAIVEERLRLVGDAVTAAGQEVQQRIADADADGAPMGDVVEQVRDTYAKQTEKWTTQAVGLSVVGSLNHASLIAARAAGVASKQWLAAHDMRVRPSHRHADGQVVPVGGQFTVGAGRLGFPGDTTGPIAEWINCRCTLLFPMPAPSVPVYVAPATPQAWATKKFDPTQPRYPKGTPGVGGQWITVPGGNVLRLAGRDAKVRARMSREMGSATPNPKNTRVLAAYDPAGRVSGYVAWQSVPEPGHQVGDVRGVWVHPAQRGQGLGDVLQESAREHEPSIGAAPRPVARSQAPSATTVPPVPRAARTTAPAGVGAGGPTGDHAADSRRVEALQRKYVAQGLSTDQQFSRNGRYTAARAAEQQAVVDHFVNKATTRSDSKLLVMGGLPGAGKTTFLRSSTGQQALGVDLDEYVSVNSDDVKEEMARRGMVPDYPGLTADESATLAQKESFEIARSVMRQAVKKRKNIAYDTTLKESFLWDQAADSTKYGAPPDYETTLVFVDVSPDTAKARAVDRYQQGGRYLPLGLIDAQADSRRPTSSRNRGAFESVKGAADRWLLVNNENGPVIKGQGTKKAGIRGRS